MAAGTEVESLGSVGQAAADQAEHERELADVKGKTVASDDDLAHQFGKDQAASAEALPDLDALLDDELRAALSDLGDVMGDVFGGVKKMSGPQRTAGDDAGPVEVGRTVNPQGPALVPAGHRRRRTRYARQRQDGAVRRPSTGTCHGTGTDGPTSLDQADKDATPLFSRSPQQVLAQVGALVKGLTVTNIKNMGNDAGAAADALGQAAQEGRAS